MVFFSPLSMENKKGKKGKKEKCDKIKQQQRQQPDDVMLCNLTSAATICKFFYILKILLPRFFFSFIIDLCKMK